MLATPLLLTFSYCSFSIEFMSKEVFRSAVKIPLRSCCNSRGYAFSKLARSMVPFTAISTNIFPIKFLIVPFPLKISSSIRKLILLISKKVSSKSPVSFITARSILISSTLFGSSGYLKEALLELILISIFGI